MRPTRKAVSPSISRSKGRNLHVSPRSHQPRGERGHHTQKDGHQRQLCRPHLSRVIVEKRFGRRRGRLHVTRRGGCGRHGWLLVCDAPATARRVPRRASAGERSRALKRRSRLRLKKPTAVTIATRLIVSHGSQYSPSRSPRSKQRPTRARCRVRRRAPGRARQRQSTRHPDPRLAARSWSTARERP